jgi:arylsulfatase A-like enzyme
MAGQNGLWGMGDHTRPAGAFDLMMQVPLIFRHAGKIPAGATSDLLVSNYDFLPSVLKYLGLADTWQQKPASPGRDYSPALLGKETSWDPVVYYEMERTRAIRTDKWKYVERHPDGPHELYDLAADHRERFNLYGQPLQADQQRALKNQLTAFFAKHVEPRYDIWNGGTSKAGRLSR